MSRDDDGKNGVFGNLQTGGLWSHHIKNVVVDREFPPDGRRRRLVSYIGGLDLTFGRFDTPEHSLFRTLSTLHKDDFYQGCVLGSSSETGPREPWHDIHCCVEGHIAWDAARTFEDRWRRQAPATAGMAIRRMPAEEFASGEEERRILLAGREHWNAQFFRSMDERSVVYDALAGKEADFSLGSKKGRAVEAGIVRAYIHYIRIAERFVSILHSDKVFSSPNSIRRELGTFTNVDAATTSHAVLTRLLYFVNSGSDATLAQICLH